MARPPREELITEDVELPLLRLGKVSGCVQALSSVLRLIGTGRQVVIRLRRSTYLASLRRSAAATDFNYPGRLSG